MKDWETCDADEMRLLGQNYASGRPYGIDYITIHHMAGDLDADGCNRAWRASGASAHYSVDRNGVVCQHVWDGDRAYACGDGVGIGSGGNDRSISIEHANNSSNPWTVYPKALEEGAHLVAALCRLYGLGRPEWMRNVFPHKHWAATACPGELAGSQNAQYMARAQYWYDKMGGKDVDKPSASKPAAAKLKVDKLWGEDTTREAQEQAGTPVDGIVSSQDKSWEPKYRGCTTGWEWVSKAEGSQLIIKIQTTLRDKYGQYVGEIDGVAGRLFWRAFERAAGYDADEKGLEYPSNTIGWFQEKLNAGTFF